jgi:phosphoglucosamine mutase
MALFGTDGIRGRYGEFLTTNLAQRVAFAAGRLLPARSRVIIGRDPRSSGALLEEALSLGFAQSGHDVIRVGIIPTPGLAFLALEPGIALGVMITASHNPAVDNGIKIFGNDGMKISDHLEEKIEEWVNSSEDIAIANQEELGNSSADAKAISRYIEHLKSSIDISLSGLTLIVDCANGAAAHVAPQVLQELGAVVRVIGGEPDGTNINEGVGSTHLEVLQQEMRNSEADLGIAHDGDADRTLLVDKQGRIIDGDAILAALAISMSDNGKLRKNTVVTTVMSNLGFHKKMSEVGISVEITAVGDRYVLERINAEGLSLGGEQSGHVIIRELSTTGDGILTALAILALIKSGAIHGDSLADVFPHFPQVLENLPVVDKARALADLDVKKAIADAESSLGEDGRILVRASGTEDLVRVMAEADTIERAQRAVNSISHIVRDRYSAR